MNHPVLAFGLPSGPDMVVIAILVLILFGAKKPPLFGRSLGRSMGEFRQARDEFGREFERELERRWSFRRPAPTGPGASPKLQVILFVAAIVALLLSFIAQGPH